MWKILHIEACFDKLDDIKWKTLFFKEHTVEKMRKKRDCLGKQLQHTCRAWVQKKELLYKPTIKRQTPCSNTLKPFDTNPQDSDSITGEGVGRLQEPENGDECWGPLCHGVAAATLVNWQLQRLPTQDLPKSNTVPVPARMPEGLVRHTHPQAEEPPEINGAWRRGSYSFLMGL